MLVGGMSCQIGRTARFNIVFETTMTCFLRSFCLAPWVCFCQRWWWRRRRRVSRWRRNQVSLFAGYSLVSRSLLIDHSMNPIPINEPLKDLATKPLPLLQPVRFRFLPTVVPSLNTLGPFYWCYCSWFDIWDTWELHLGWTWLPCCSSCWLLQR